MIIKSPEGNKRSSGWPVGWLFLGLSALWDRISVSVGPSLRNREKEKTKDRRDIGVGRFRIFGGQGLKYWGGGGGGGQGGQIPSRNMTSY